MGSPLPGVAGGSEGGSSANIPDKLLLENVWKDTFWCYYCCCEGCGFGDVKDPFCAAEYKELCCRGSCSTTDIMADDGLCNSLEVCLCCVQFCSFPCYEEQSCCKCCNMQLVEKSPMLHSAKFNEDLFHPEIVPETFWCYHCCSAESVSLSLVISCSMD